MENYNPNYERPPANISAVRPGSKELDYRKHDRQYKNAQTATNVLIVIFTAVTACVGLWQTSLTKAALQDAQNSTTMATRQTWSAVENINWLARTMDGSLKEAQTAREINERWSKAALDTSIETSRQDQRAWVIASGVNIEQWDNGKAATFQVLLKNTGRSPAIDAHAWIGSTVNIGKIKKSDPVGNKVPLFLLAPGDTVHTSNQDDPFSQQELSQIMNGLRVYVYGTVRYRDIFGRKHWSQFCVIPSNTFKEFNPCGFHNTCDDCEQRWPKKE